MKRGPPSNLDRLRDDLSEFDQVAGRVREEGKLAADGVELERLGHDLDAAGSEIGDGLLDIRHVDAEVVIAGVAQTIAKVGIPGSVDRRRIAATQQFDQEGVVVRGGDIGELLVGIGPFVHNPEIELLDVPVLRLIEVFHAHADVVAAPACESWSDPSFDPKAIMRKGNKF